MPKSLDWTAVDARRVREGCGGRGWLRREVRLWRLIDLVSANWSIRDNENVHAFLSTPDDFFIFFYF
jgi:hypothetical protein